MLLALFMALVMCSSSFADGITIQSRGAKKGVNDDITSMTGLDNDGIPLAKVANAASDGANSDITSLSGLTTPLTVAQGGQGSATLADGGILVGAATGPVEVVAAGATTDILVGGGAGTNPVWTAATGTGSPVRATSPALVTPTLPSVTGGVLRLWRDDTSATQDDLLGNVEFYTNDGDGPHVAAYIKGLASDFPGSDWGRYGAMSFGIALVANTDAVEVARFDLAGSFLLVNASGPALMAAPSSATVPTLIPNQAELDTGFGWAASDTLTATTGGLEQLRLATGTATFSGTAINMVESGTTLTVGVGADNGTVSAGIFTDRTKGFDGDALALVNKIKSKDSEIDHDTLPDFAVVHLTRDILEDREEIIKGKVKLKKVKVGEKVDIERDLGAMITLLTRSVQQLTERIEQLESQ